MEELIKRIFKSGRSVYLTDFSWKSNVYRAFFQPLRYKNKMYMNGVVNELGHYKEGYYLYIGPVEHDITKLTKCALIYTQDGKCYEFQTSEIVYLKDKPLYIWAIVKEKL